MCDIKSWEFAYDSLMSLKMVVIYVCHNLNIWRITQHQQMLLWIWNMAWWIVIVDMNNVMAFQV